MTQIPNDVPRYRKRSNKKAPAKSNHKHEYVNCVYDVPTLRFEQTRGFLPTTRTAIGTYCKICGKVGDIYDHTWFSVSNTWPPQWSNKAEQEFEESTRTLPRFKLDDLFQKFVNNE